MRGPALRRLATKGSRGEGVVFTNAACGFEVTADWFEPGYWQAQGAIVGSAAGRGTTVFFQHGAGQYVLRRYRRGGLAARISVDRYLWQGEIATRPLRELKLMLRMEADGLPVPTAVAARYQRRGPTYSGDIITCLLPESWTLAQYLDHAEMSLPGWAAIGRCIRRFHDRGYCHADLNAHNVLLHGDSEVYLIDFDRGSRRKPGLWQDANLARLLRSLEKLDDARGLRRMDMAQWQCLLAAYQTGGG